MESIEDIICPDRNKIVLNKGIITAKIVDIELDPIDLIFNNDGCVEIDTKEYTYLMLSIENLVVMIDLIKSSEKKYNEIDED